MLLTLGLHKDSHVRSYSEHRILTPKIPKKPKTVILCRRDKHRLSGIRNECNLPEANDDT